MAKARIALLGMPNTGKSTLFNRLSGASARVANWPGLTVELESARLLLGARMVELVDLPGLHNLHGFSEDEGITRRFLEHQPLNALLLVLNATQIERQLSLVLQLKRLGLPMLLVLNMSDEAARRGVRVDSAALAAELGCPVVMASAKYGHGIREILAALKDILRDHPEPRQAIAAALTEDDDIEHLSQTLLSRTVRLPDRPASTLSDRVDDLMLHPVIGLGGFFLIILALFQAVYGLGAPLQKGLGALLEQIKGDWLIPALANLPPLLASFITDGLYDGAGTVASFLPIIFVFYLVMGAVEDSGYLARAAFLMDGMMSRLGLDGRAFVMQIMGFGCNVPAIMGTRVLRNPVQRRLTMLIIPFSLCSARLQVFLFFATALFSPKVAPWVLFSLYVLSFVIAFVTALIWRRRGNAQDPLIMELPPYRVPTLRYLMRQSLLESGRFLRQAGGFILLGVSLVWLLTHLPAGVEPASPQSWAGQLAGLAQPIFKPLGIDELLSITLLFGFVAKEVVIGAMAVIYGVGPSELQGVLARHLDWAQAYSFMLFTLLYTPCLSTLAVIRRESHSLRFTLASLVWSLGTAWLVSFAFYNLVR